MFLIKGNSPTHHTHQCTPAICIREIPLHKICNREFPNIQNEGFCEYVVIYKYIQFYKWLFLQDFVGRHWKMSNNWRCRTDCIFFIAFLNSPLNFGPEKWYGMSIDCTFKNGLFSCLWDKYVYGALNTVLFDPFPKIPKTLYFLFFLLHFKIYFHIWLILVVWN